MNRTVGMFCDRFNQLRRTTQHWQPNSSGRVAEASERWPSQQRM